MALNCLLYISLSTDPVHELDRLGRRHQCLLIALRSFDLDAAAVLTSEMEYSLVIDGRGLQVKQHINHKITK